MWIKYNIEKKQVSIDRGVTWQDVTPYETRYGKQVGAYDTFLGCEDSDCDLEEYRCEVIDGELPTEICGEFVLPEGIAKKVKFTSGAICDVTWRACELPAFDYILGEETSVGIGSRICVNGYCPGFNYREATINGMSMTGCCLSEYVCVCYQITELMPWAKGKETWKLIRKTHYVREHCTDEWSIEGEPEIVGFGERWKFIDDDFYSETWQHQIATGFDKNGNVTEWTDSGSTDGTYYDSNLPAGVEIISGINADGEMYCNNSVFIEDMSIQLKTNSANPSGTVIHSQYFFSGDIAGRSIAVSDESSTSGEIVIIITPTSEYEYFRHRGIGGYGCLFGKFYRHYIGGGKYTTSIVNKLNGITSGKIRKWLERESIQDMNGTLFPYRIDVGDGQYEYGYIRRDGTMYPLTKDE